VLCVGIVVAAVGEAHVLVGGADADAVHGCGAVFFDIVARKGVSPPSLPSER
jgi:hypothetical protein